MLKNSKTNANQNINDFFIKKIFKKSLKRHFVIYEKVRFDQQF